MLIDRQVYHWTPKPITTADSNYWEYIASELKAIRDVFGDRIGDAVENGPQRMFEKTIHRISTESVRTNFPRQSFQDALVWLDVGFASDFARALFPKTGQAVRLPPPTESLSEIPRQTTNAIAMEHEGMSASMVDTGK